MKEYRYEDCVIQVSDDKSVAMAWVNGGAYPWYIRKSEMDMFRFDPERALRHMSHRVRKGTYRCSSCGWEGPRGEFTNAQKQLLCVACSENP